MADINFENYKAKSSKGLWTVIKNAKGLAIQRKQFNVDDGLEASPVLEYFDLAELKKIQTHLQKRLTDINLLVKEAELL